MRAQSELTPLPSYSRNGVMCCSDLKLYPAFGEPYVAWTSELRRARQVRCRSGGRSGSELLVLT